MLKIWFDTLGWVFAVCGLIAGFFGGLIWASQYVQVELIFFFFVALILVCGITTGVACERHELEESRKRRESERFRNGRG